MLKRKPKKIEYDHVQAVNSAEKMGLMLRNRRKELGYTQEQIAKMMKVSPRLIGELERGRGTVAFDTVMKYAKGLGIEFTARVWGH